MRFVLGLLASLLATVAGAQPLNIGPNLGTSADIFTPGATRLLPTYGPISAGYSCVGCAAPTITARSMVGHVDGVTGLPAYSVTGAGSTRNGFGSTRIGSCVDTVNHLLFVGGTGIKVWVLDASNQLTSPKPTYVLGLPDFVTDTTAGPVAQNTITSAGGFVCDGANNRLFVSDTANRVLVFNTNSATIATNENAFFVFGQADYVSSGTATTQAGLSKPTGLAYDATNKRLFVLDTNNNRVIVYDATPGNMTVNGPNAIGVVGQTLYTTATSSLTQSGINHGSNGPLGGLVYDPTNTRLYVGDTGGKRVTIFNVALGFSNGLNASNVLGQTSYTSTSGGSASTRFTPQGLAFDLATRRLFVVDNAALSLYVFDMTSVSNGQAAIDDMASGWSTFDLPTQASWSTVSNQPDPIYFDSGDLYVPDPNYYRLLRFNAASGTIVDGANATYALGHVDPSGGIQYTAWDVNNSPTPQSAFNVNNIALDATHHRLFVTDYNKDPVITATGARVLVYTLDSSNHISSLTASNVIGWPDFYGHVTNAATSSTFGIHVTGSCYDATNDRLFAVDSFNNRVLVFNTATITDGMAAAHVLGQALFTTSAAATTQAGLSNPRGCVYDSTNSRLFIADTNNNRVVVYDVDPARIADGANAVGVLGQTLYTTSAAATTSTGMRGPQQQMAYDEANSRLFVYDAQNNRILIFTAAPSFTNGKAADFVLGQSDFVSSASGTSASRITATSNSDEFRLVGGLTYDQAWGRLFFGDTLNFRVLIWDATLGTLATGQSANALLGQPSFTANTQGSGASNGNGYSEGGAFNLATNTYFDVQWAPDRVMELPMIKITTATLPDGTHNVAYSQTVAISQAQGTTQRFRVSSGALPTGLTLNTTTGVISGTPSAAGAYTFVIEADDNFSTGPLFDRISYTVTIS